MVSSSPAQQVAQALAKARFVLITSHRSPDGDALGSELALAEMCQQLGVEAIVINRDPHPASLDFLPGLPKVHVLPAIPADWLAKADLVVFLECPHGDRPGFAELLAKPLVNIDHHLDNPAYGTVNFVDPEAPAVGEMLMAVADAASIPLTKTMATCLYTALVTDTGDFRFSNATPRAFTAAARLVEAGAEPAAIAEALNDHVPARVIRLQAEVLSTLELYAHGRVAVITCTSEMLQQVGAGPEDTEDMVNIPRSIHGVKVAVFFKAFAPQTVKVSLRSKGAIDVQKIAASFGGGGHTNASGLTFTGDLNTARQAILKAVISALEAP